MPTMKQQKKVELYLLGIGITKPNVQKLTTCFDDLIKQQEAKKNSLRLSDITPFLDELESIGHESADVEEHAMLFGMEMVARHYPRLLPIFLWMVKEHQVLIKTDIFINHFILPMLLKGARTGDSHVYNSLYFGSIILAQYTANKNNFRKYVKKVDESFAACIEKDKKSNRASALDVYATAILYLNRVNAPTISRYSLSNYITEKSTDVKLKPTIILASLRMLTLLYNKKKNGAKFQLQGFTELERQVMVIRVHKKKKISEVINTFIHEIQHVMNYVIFNQNIKKAIYKANKISSKAIKKFEKLIEENADSENMLTTKILVNIKLIIVKVGELYSEQNIDELSAHFVSLLFDYSTKDIRNAINYLQLAGKENKKIINLYYYIDQSFSLIESTLYILTEALYKLKRNEFIDSWVEKNPTAHGYNVDELNTVKRWIDGQCDFQYSWEDFYDKIKNQFNAKSKLYDLLSQRMQAYVLPANPLHYAAARGYNKTVRYLIGTKKCLINSLDRNGFSPLVYAMLANQDKIAMSLLKAGASVDSKTYTKMSASLKELAQKNKITINYSPRFFVPSAVSKQVPPNVPESRYSFK